MELFLSCHVNQYKRLQYDQTWEDKWDTKSFILEKKDCQKTIIVLKITKKAYKEQRSGKVIETDWEHLCYEDFYF